MKSLFCGFALAGLVLTSWGGPTCFAASDRHPEVTMFTVFVSTHIPGYGTIWLWPRADGKLDLKRDQNEGGEEADYIPITVTPKLLNPGQPVGEPYRFELTPDIHLIETFHLDGTVSLVIKAKMKPEGFSEPQPDSSDLNKVIEWGQRRKIANLWVYMPMTASLQYREKK